tara:strand:+ start:553 stop:765 length:213 start_codon:yes stop_codon:yes gene_type:complete
MKKKIFELGQLEKIYVDSVIKGSPESEHDRMELEYENYKQQGCVVDHYNHIGVKKIVMTSPKGKVVEVKE